MKLVGCWVHHEGFQQPQNGESQGDQEEHFTDHYKPIRGRILHLRKGDGEEGPVKSDPILLWGA